MGSPDFSSSRHPVDIRDTWILELDRHLGWNDMPRSYRLLSAVLRALRDAPLEGRVDAVARFPVRLCGTLCDNAWVRPAGTTDVNVGNFLDCVAVGFKPDPIDDPATAILAVFDLLSGKIDGSEIEPLRESLCQALMVPALDVLAVRRSA